MPQSQSTDTGYGVERTAFIAGGSQGGGDKPQTHTNAVFESGFVVYFKRKNKEAGICLKRLITEPLKVSKAN